MLSRLAFRQNFACWNMTSLVLWNLIHFPFEPMPLASNRDLTLKNVLLEKCVDELHCIFFFYLVQHSQGGLELVIFCPRIHSQNSEPFHFLSKIWGILDFCPPWFCWWQLRWDASVLSLLCLILIEEDACIQTMHAFRPVMANFKHYLLLASWGHSEGIQDISGCVCHPILFQSSLLSVVSSQLPR